MRPYSKFKLATVFLSLLFTSVLCAQQDAVPDATAMSDQTFQGKLYTLKV